MKTVSRKPVTLASTPLTWIRGDDKLPPARLGGVFMDELPKQYSIIKRDMWLSGKRYIRKQSNGLHHAVVAQLVERHLAKVDVVSPSLIYRSKASRDTYL